MTGIRCTICGGECVRDVIVSNYSYWKCNSCFTSQLYPQPTIDELDGFYEKFHESNGIYEEFEERVNQDFNCKFNLVKSFKDGRLLDVACGKGYFVKKCIDNGLDAMGLDISETAVEYARSILKVNAMCCTLDSLSEDQKETYDTVTFWAGIEHVPNPREVIKSIYRILRPGGIFILDTGLGDVTCEKYLPGHSQWYSAPEHLFVFSLKGLLTLVQENGFDVLSVDEDFERNIFRRYIKKIRHLWICVIAYVVIRPIIGERSFKNMKERTKWPIGKLVNIICKKAEKIWL